MSGPLSPEQVIGELAANAIEWIGGRRIIGSVRGVFWIIVWRGVLLVPLFIARSLVFLLCGGV